jgi:hypothetical protein
LYTTGNWGMVEIGRASYKPQLLSYKSPSRDYAKQQGASFR